jgi:hypothetical protein
MILLSGTSSRLCGRQSTQSTSCALRGVGVAYGLVLCQTPDVGYHETFWVVAGAAAPVIALASIVAVGATQGALSARGNAIIREFANPHTQMETGDFLKAWRGTAILTWVQRFDLVTTALQGLALLASLTSLSLRRDLISANYVTFAEVYGLFALFGTTFTKSRVE